VKRRDLHNLKECYTQILTEDLGIGPIAADQMTSVVGANFPDNPTPQTYEDQAKSMAVADLKDAIKNISEILNQLRSSRKLEAWVAEKITLASDYLDTVESWVTNKE
jgi:hypothetical protein